jgi:AcrR family transcriptional regulator
MHGKNHLRRARTATYEKGQVRIEAILDAAAGVLINEGYKKLTLRQIALRAGITVGNLTYYYRNKEALLKDLLEKILSTYLDEMDRIVETSGDSPEDHFVAIVEYLIEDLNTERTSKFFPELWALANHDDYALELMETMYANERKALAELICAINPNLDEQQTRNLALFISSSIEGMTMFVGAGKKQEGILQPMKKIACRSFLQLITQPGTPHVAKQSGTGSLAPPIDL